MSTAAKDLLEDTVELHRQDVLRRLYAILEEDPCAALIVTCYTDERTGLLVNESNEDDIED